MVYISFEQWRKLVGVAPIYFAYKKLDGTLRLARGTNNSVVAKFLGFTEFEKVTEGYVNPNSYFDFDRRDWRCFSTRCNDDILIFDNEKEYLNYQK